MIGSMEQSSWCITTDHGQDVIDGAVEFMKFYTKPVYSTKRAVEAGELSSVVDFPQDEYDKMIPPMKKLCGCLLRCEYCAAELPDKVGPCFSERCIRKGNSQSGVRKYHGG